MSDKIIRVNRELSQVKVLTDGCQILSGWMVNAEFGGGRSHHGMKSFISAEPGTAVMHKQSSRCQGHRGKNKGLVLKEPGF